MTNFFTGLARGPIDHDASSVINAVSNGEITMGSALQLVDIASVAPAEILPRVEEIEGLVLTDLVYGIAVGGDTDGIYGDGDAATDDTNLATASAGQGVVVVTQGRCLARVDTTFAVDVGSPLSASDADPGMLELAATGAIVVARALQPLTITTGNNIIAVDIQREGLL